MGGALSKCQTEDLTEAGPLARTRRKLTMALREAAVQSRPLKLMVEPPDAGEVALELGVVATRPLNRAVRIARRRGAGGMIHGDQQALSGSSQDHPN